ncbi:adhesion G protein-coupled receptor L4-like [Physella acuta]|uniref:adhesion G protein-coupled receptor L4-like n=1 Tax=Physella acuta TaxID=109671 RepID=UPI0027DCEB88|nr:adhesion G protein-coupled receptor L4-like [Physella acuta]
MDCPDLVKFLLTVCFLLCVACAAPPTISANNSTPREGDMLNLTCVTQDQNVTSYAWFLNGAILITSSSPSYVIAYARMAWRDDGNYSCRTVHSDLTYEESPALSITVLRPETPISFKYFILGRNATLTCTPNGNFTFYFFHGPVLIQNSTSNVYRFPVVTFNDAGFYRCGIDDLSAPSPPFEVKVWEAPATPVIQSSPVYPSEGDDTVLTCVASVSSTNYTWTLHGRELANQTERTLYIQDAKPGVNDGNFTCVVYDNVTRSDPSVNYTLKLLPRRPSLQPTGSYTLKPGSDLTLTCVTNSTGVIDYVLLRNNVELRTSNSSVFVFSGLATADSGVYYCAARNYAGQITSAGFYNLTFEQSCPPLQEQGVVLPSATIGHVVETSCPTDYTGTVVARCCTGSIWCQINKSNCTQNGLVDVCNYLTNISKINDTAMKETINSLSTLVKATLEPAPTVSGDLIAITDILGKIGDSLDTDNHQLDSQSLESLVYVADYVLSQDGKVWDEIDHNSSNTDQISDEEASASGIQGKKLLKAIDAISTPRSNNISLFTVKNSMAVQCDSTAEDIYFPPKIINLSKPTDDWLTNTTSQLFLPKESYMASQGSINFCTVMYKVDERKLKVLPWLQQKYPEGRDLADSVIFSNIITCNLNINTANLDPPLRLEFRKGNENETYSVPTCGFLDTTVGEGGVWASTGCHVVEDSATTVVCQCSHLTNFALLMSPHRASKELDNSLSIISIIGCSISMVCLVCTVGVYAVLWKQVKSDRSTLNIHLCVCLFLGYIIFLSCVDKAQNRAGCVVIAAVLHYIFLVIFFLMLAESVELFKSVTMVFKSNSILIQLLVLAYVAPAVIVALSLCITTAEGYGFEDFCWLSTENGVIWAFIVPVLLIILINFATIVQVLRVMQGTKHMMSQTAKEKAKITIRTIGLLSPVLGVTWVLGVLSVNEDSVVFQYLFAILNSLQGVFIFIFYCIVPQQVKKSLLALIQKTYLRLTSAIQSRINIKKKPDVRHKLSSTQTPSVSDTNLTSSGQSRSANVYDVYAINPAFGDERREKHSEITSETTSSDFSVTDTTTVN